MAHWKELFSGGDYLSGAEFKGKTFTGRIATVSSCSLEDDNGKKKSIPIVTWDIAAKPWLMCKTTCICLAAMFGPDPTGWVGKRVTLYATMVPVGRGQELGVRVKGGPDLPAPLDVEVKLPRKRPVKVTLVPTGKGAAPAATPPPKPEPTPPADDEPGADDDQEHAA